MWDEMNPPKDHKCMCEEPLSEKSIIQSYSSEAHRMNGLKGKK